MRFRVTAITGASESAAVGRVTVAMEDALNASLKPRDLGISMDQLTLVIVSSYDDTAENERWASTRDSLSGVRNPITGERLRHLQIAVPVAPSTIASLSPVELNRHLARAIVDAVAMRPDGAVSGLNFRALAAALRNVLLPHG